MTNPQQQRISKTRLGRPDTALTFVVVLGVAMILTMSAQAQTLNVLHAFGGTPDGAFPQSDVTLDRDGNVYGTAAFDGTSGLWGSVFVSVQVAKGVWEEKALYNFTGGNDGGLPVAGVIFDKKGNLFGTTFQNGPNGNGVVFELTPSEGAWKETVIHAFPENNNDGGWPVGDLTFDDNGNLYGTANIGGAATNNCQPNGCGIVFRLTPQPNGTWKETVLYQFTGESDGGNPYGSVIMDKSGNLYGTTSQGGGGNCAYGCGVVFELSPQSGGSWKETTLYSFTGTGSDGAFPYCNLTFDQAGNLYGTTTVGGVNGGGIAFELTRSQNWKETVLYSFVNGIEQYSPTGSNPYGGMTFGPTGNLYGMTNQGGLYYDGVVFELTPSQSGWNETVLYNFDGLADGSYPLAGVTLDKQGNIYGTTSGDGDGSGPDSFGSLFQLTP